MKLYNYIFILILIFLPYSVLAETVVRTGNAISVEKSQSIKGDYYVSVGPLGNTSMSGEVLGDMYALGGSVTVNGVVNEDLVILSGVSQIHATVKDDVRILSGEVVIANDIEGDLFVIASNLKVLSSAHIGGNIYFFGRSGIIEGKVDGAIHGTSQNLTINGSVGKDVDVNIHKQLTLGSQASIVGNVTYASNSTLVRAPEVTIEGDVQKRQLFVNNQNKDSQMVINLVPFLITLFTSLTLYLLFSRNLLNLLKRTDNHHITKTLIGFAVIIFMPLAAIFLILTVLGFLVGLMTAGLAAILLATGYALSSIVSGAYLAKFFTGKIQVTLLWLFVGTAVLQLIIILPIIGPALILLITAFSVGIIVTRLYQLLSNK